MAVVAVVLCAAALAGMAAADAPAEFNGPFDLSHTVGTGTNNIPGMGRFNLTRQFVQDDERGFLAFNEFCMAEHLATHLDAPYHFNKSNWKVHEIPVGRLIGPGVLLDASAEAAADRDLALGADALARWEAAHGRVPVGAIVLVRFGWADKFSNLRDYFGLGTDSSDPGQIRFPGLSAELARALAERKVYGVGVDTPSVDPGKPLAGGHPAHRALSAALAYNLENLDLRHLRASVIPPAGFTVIALPAKIEGGSGAPVRVLAVPNSPETPWPALARSRAGRQAAQQSVVVQE